MCLREARNGMWKIPRYRAPALVITLTKNVVTGEEFIENVGINSESVGNGLSSAVGRFLSLNPNNHH
jgi:hypothetical protein